MLTKYKITYGAAVAEVTYSQKVIQYIEVIESQDIDLLLQRLPPIEDDLITAGCNIKPMKVPAVAEKIALWCRLYKDVFGAQYKVTAAETGLAKNTPFLETEIITFFQLNVWYAKEKTISRYCKNYNDIARITAAGGDAADTGNAKANTGSSALGSAFQRRYANNATGGNSS